MAVMVAATAGLVSARPAAAGIDAFNVSFRTGNVGISLGYSDYPVWSQRFYDPSWSMDYDQMLDGYGEWVYMGGLGRVWHPWVRTDWRPYLYGRWVWTSMGWTWISYEPWGYVPHHYGYWALAPVGWVWVPGYDYCAANVVWLASGSHFGWYPRGPRGWSHAERAFRHGYDHGYGRGYGDGYRDGWDDAQYATWVYSRDITAPDIAARARPVRELGRGGDLRAFDRAPDRREIERVVGRRIDETRIERRQVRADGHTIEAVRPAGVEQDIRNHARETVERGLAPEISRSLARGERVTRHAAPGSLDRQESAGGERGRREDVVTRGAIREPQARQARVRERAASELEAPRHVVREQASRDVDVRGRMARESAARDARVSRQVMQERAAREAAPAREVLRQRTGREPGEQRIVRGRTSHVEARPSEDMTRGGREMAASEQAGQLRGRATVVGERRRAQERVTVERHDQDAQQDAGVRGARERGETGSRGRVGAGRAGESRRLR